MSLAGYLSEYSLAEIFHFVQEGNKTGLLLIEPDRLLAQSTSSTYSISFQSGRVMSVATDLEHRRLLKMMEQRKWLSPEQSKMVEYQLSAIRQPLGTYLKSQGILNTEQLTLLFNQQVVAMIAKLFEIQQGQFKFDLRSPLTYAEMTGLSMTAKEAALMGLRVMRDWSGLVAKLPAPESALQRLSSEPIGLRLDTQEWQVWKLALGEIPISKIAEQLDIVITKVQQIGFRLSSIGLMQEVSLEPPQPSMKLMMEAPTPICVGGGNASAPVSASFLSNLMGFLKKKGG
jgi:hypothetical protein